MKRIFTLAGVALIALGLHTKAEAQAQWVGWQGECLDPAATTSPYTNPVRNAIGDGLIAVTLGAGGSVTYGPTASTQFPCYLTSRQQDFAGGFTFGVDGDGSVQSTFDDFMAYTFGWPDDPMVAYNYAMITTTDDSVANAVLFDTPSLFYTGLSKRYIVSSFSGAGPADPDGNTPSFTVDLQAKVLGDAVRMRWRIRNTGTTTASFGLRFGFCPWMDASVGDINGNTIANTVSEFQAGLVNSGGNLKLVNNYIGYTYMDTRRPLRSMMKRDSTDVDFPSFVDFFFGQSDNYGMRIENRPGSSTPDATNANFVLLGDYAFQLAGGMSDSLFGDPVAKDLDVRINSMACIQRFGVQPVLAGDYRDIVHYVRSTWSVADYSDPYTVVIDAPHVVNFPGGGTNSQDPNPMTVRTWIDNQYATIDKEVALHEVKVTITLPDGLTLANGDSAVKYVAQIDPNDIVPFDFRVESDGKTFGDLPVKIQVDSVPGPTKTLTTTIRVAAAPTLSLAQGPNMVSFPFTFGDNSMDAVLGLITGQDYVAYTWDAQTGGYAPVTSTQRGIGYWVIPNAAHTALPLNNASRPTDIEGGQLLVNLKPGWNLIGNPYNYPIKLSDLVGVAENNPSDSLTWNQMIQADFLTSALTYFNPDPNVVGGGSYKLTTGSSDVVAPLYGYWIYNRTAQAIRLIWPPVFEPGVSGITGRADQKTWKQTDREWRLQLSARSTIGMDSDNYVGVVTDTKKADQLQVPKAPMAPNGNIELSILDQYSGQTTRMAQAVKSRSGSQTWKVQVRAEKAGDVTLTWPNLASVPRGVRAKITDDVTGEKKDLRTTSGYTFKMDKPGTRTFTLSVEPGGASKPVIGNVLVRPAGRDLNSPVVVSYALSADASVTVRILSGTGKEVYTVTRSRADNAGENTVTWTLHDNANRAVAPGTYRVEILAETPSGERVRKIVPVNVVR